jgi:hypothetical protein
MMIKACDWFDKVELDNSLEEITTHAKHDNQYIETNFKYNG